MSNEMIAFGPVPSRRLGQSLGINNIPPKSCSYSCVYCQVGRTPTRTIHLSEFYAPEAIFSAVTGRVLEIQRRREPLDFLTFVADGEPTLDAHLGREIELLRPLGVPIAVISNASLLWREQVREALRLAEVENAYLQESRVFPGSESIVGNILQDLVWTAHLERSSRLASEIQRRLARLPGPSRGVRQAPFVVLMGVNMPAVLVEIGFLTHPVEGRRLREKPYLRAIATALGEAVRAYQEKEEEGPR